MLKKNNALVELNVLFTISHGNKLDLNKFKKRSISENAVAFIGRSGEDNGIVAFVDKIKDEEPFEKGYITVALGGSVLSSFVQPFPFYTAQNIDVLKPNVKMTLDEKLYYCLCIEANRFRYSTYGREANRTLSRLLVPDMDSLPEWVNGAKNNAVDELNKDLKLVVAEDEI